MYLKQYEREGTKNLDTNPVFSNPNAMPDFQDEQVEFKKNLTEMGYTVIPYWKR